MTGWWLSVFMFVNGAWVSGASLEVDGWAPREYETSEICETRKAFTIGSLAQSAAAGRAVTPTHWVCNEGAALTEVPADLPPPVVE